MKGKKLDLVEKH